MTAFATVLADALAAETTAAARLVQLRDQLGAAQGDLAGAAGSRVVLGRALARGATARAGEADGIAQSHRNAEDALALAQAAVAAAEADLLAAQKALDRLLQVELDARAAAAQTQAEAALAVFNEAKAALDAANFAATNARLAARPLAPWPPVPDARRHATLRQWFEPEIAAAAAKPARAA